MFKITPCFMAVALAFGTIAASAQETSNKSDLFGQDSSGTNSTSTQSQSTQQRKVRITNGMTEEQGVLGGRSVDSVEGHTAGARERNDGERERTGGKRDRKARGARQDENNLNERRGFVDSEFDENKPLS